jgi:hypothetical protein
MSDKLERVRREQVVAQSSYYSKIGLEGLRKPQNLIKIASIRGQIRTEHILNTSLDGPATPTQSAGVRINY